MTTENETLQKETTPSDNTNIVMETPLAVSPVHEEEEMCGLLSLTFPIPEKNPLSKKNPEKTEEFITKFKALLRTIQHPEIKKIVCDKASAYDTNKNDEEEPQYAFKNKGDAALMISKINTELKKLVIHNPSACESSIMFAETLSTTTLNTEVTTLIKALKKFSGEL